MNMQNVEGQSSSCHPAFWLVSLAGFSDLSEIAKMGRVASLQGVLRSSAWHDELGHPKTLSRQGWDALDIQDFRREIWSEMPI